MKHKTLSVRLLLSLAFLVPGVFPGFAATITWTNNANGLWNTAANWNPNSVPGLNDTAIITNSGVTVSLGGATTVGGVILGTNGVGTVTLSLAGQTLTLDGPLTVNPTGSFTLSSGTLAGNTNAVLSGAIGWTGGLLGGTLTIATNGIVTVAGRGGNNDLPNCTLTNYGTVAWTNGTIRGGQNPGTFIYNYGLWNAQSDQTITTSGYGGSGVVFNNFGTFRKSGGTGESANGYTVLQSGVVFNQLGGMLDVLSGTNGLELVLQGGGSFTGGYITTNQNGLTVLSSGSFTLDGTVTGTNTWEDAGNLVGTNVIAGALTWVAGNWNSAPSVTIAPNTTLVVAGGGGNNDLGNCLMTNNGTVAWASGAMRGGASSPGTVIYNYGLWNAQSDQTFNTSGYGGNGVVFNNFGTFRKSVGASANSTLLEGGVLFNQTSGELDVQNGNLVLQGSGNFTGGFVTTNATGTTVLSEGSFNINGTLTGSNVVENAGNLVGANIIAGALTWVAGVWNGATVTIAPNSTVLVEGGANNNDMGNVILTNNGTLAWVSGNMRGGGNPGTFIYNYGLWNAQSDETFNTASFGGSGVTFNNFGTFRKSVGASTNSTLLEGGVLFNQTSGELDVQNGNLVLQGSGNFTGGFVTTNATGTTVLSLGSFNINGTLTGSNVVENSGNLVGANIIAGALTWVAGVWNGATVTIAPNSTVLVEGGANNNDMGNVILTNNGTLAWASGNMRGGGNPGTFIYNYGLWNVQSDETFNTASFGGSGVMFNNFGTFRKSVGASTNSTLLEGGVLFNQTSGELDVQNGNLVLQGSGNFTGGFVTTNAAGTTVLSLGSFNINGALTGSNVVENSGNLVGANNINGALTWVAGVWNGATVTIATNSTVTVAGGANNNNDLGNVTLTNNGTLAWASGNMRGGGNPGTFIYNYGLWNAESDQTFNTASFGGSGVMFNNFGTFRKSGGTGEFTNGYTQLESGVVFNQLAGALDVQNGTNGLELVLQGGGNFTGGYVSNNQFGLTVLSAGNFTLNGAVTGANTWQAGANLVGTNVIYGALTWVSGVWNGATMTITTNSLVTVAGGANNNNDMGNVTLTNYGTLAWASGNMRGGGNPGTFIYNYGLWNAESDQTFNTASFGGSGVMFNNLGAFRKTGTSGGSSQLQSGITFTNRGTLDSQAGNISLQGSFALANGTLNFGINSLTNYGTISLTGAAPLTGTVSANLNNGYQPIGGNSFTNLSYGSYSGAFTNATLPFLDAWNTNYYPTYFVFNVLNARPIFASQTTNLFFVNELATLTVTNTATDADLPPQTLIYSLAAGPSGTGLNTITGVITWTPSQTQSPSTNSFAVAVGDNGTPPLSNLNYFTVIVYAPTLAPISGATVNVGQTVVFTAVGTDNDPTRTLTYSLVSAPLAATINPATGTFTWLVGASAANTTSTIVVKVSDNSTPVLSATQSFKVTVNALAGPVILGPITLAAGQAKIQVNGPPGPVYILQGSATLAHGSWGNLLTNTPSSLPFTMIDTNAGTLKFRFYRIQLGP